MGFYVIEEYEHKATGLVKERLYVNINSFAVSWYTVDNGEKKYTCESSYRICIDKGKAPLGINSIRFNITKDEVDNYHIPSLIYSYIKENCFVGYTFDDDL